MKITSKSQGQAGFIDSFSEASDLLRKDPYRVGLLPKAVTQAMLQLPLPFPTEFWIAEENGSVLGRIGANVSPVHRGIGYVGFFEACDPEVAGALLQHASDWLKSRGIREAYGPMNFNTWFHYRFRTNPDTSPRFSFEPVNPPEYPTWWEKNGWEKAETYHTQAVSGIDGIIEGTRAGYEKALAAGYSFRPFDGARLLEREVPILHCISMIGFAQNLLFEPMPLEMFRQLYVPVANKVDLSLAHFALDPQGKEVGFFFVFAEGGYFVMKSTAVLPEARGKGLSNGIIHLGASLAKARGVGKAMSALVRDGIQSESYARKEKPEWRHEYALYKRAL